jgi:hypothetical protein
MQYGTSPAAANAAPIAVPIGEDPKTITPR